MEYHSPQQEEPLKKMNLLSKSEPWETLHPLTARMNREQQG